MASSITHPRQLIRLAPPGHQYGACARRKQHRRSNNLEVLVHITPRNLFPQLDVWYCHKRVFGSQFDVVLLSSAMVVCTLEATKSSIGQKSFRLDQTGERAVSGVFVSCFHIFNSHDLC